MSFFQRLKKLIPRPFLFIQRQLNIQAEWKEFKINVRPHRYKLYILVLIATYPLYSPHAKYYYNQSIKYIKNQTDQSLQPNQAVFQITQNFVKNLIGAILSDNNIKQQGLSFVHSIINDQKFVAEILTLLTSALKNQEFLKMLGDNSKQIIIKQLQDQQLQKQLIKFIQKIGQSQQVRKSFISLIQQAFSSQQSINTMINLLTKGITSPQVKGALSEAVNFSVRELLVDQQTLNQLKIFIFFLLRKFQSDDQIKGMMDILFAKGLGLVKKKKDPQLQKILKMGKQKVDFV